MTKDELRHRNLVGLWRRDLEVLTTIRTAKETRPSQRERSLSRMRLRQRYSKRTEKTMAKRQVTFEFDDDKTFRGLQKATEEVRSQFGYFLLSALLSNHEGFYINAPALSRFGVTVVPTTKTEPAPNN